jgi:hypothetical protein
MYVLVRTDLSKPQQAVQACHAVLNASREFVAIHDKHPSMVLLAIKNEVELRKWEEKLLEKGIRHRAFVEPDIGHQMTAIATEPLCGDDRLLFKRLQLIKG